MEQIVVINSAKLWISLQRKGTSILFCNGGPGCAEYLGPVAEMVNDLA